VSDTEAAPPIRRVAGRYRVERLAGRGGAAAVYQARDEVLGRTVAIKLFPPGVAPSEVHRRQQEVQTLAGLNHPGLVTVYDAGSDRDQIFIAMEHVDGEPLRTWLQTAHPWREILDVFASVQMPRFPDQVALALKLPGSDHIPVLAEIA